MRKKLLEGCSVLWENKNFTLWNRSIIQWNSARKARNPNMWCSTRETKNNKSKGPLKKREKGLLRVNKFFERENSIEWSMFHLHVMIKYQKRGHPLLIEVPRGKVKLKWVKLGQRSKSVVWSQGQGRISLESGYGTSIHLGLQESKA